MSRSSHRNRKHDDDDIERIAAKEDRRQRREADATAKESQAQKPPGLRTQGEVRIVNSGEPRGQYKPLGRRAEPTRFDAMPIVGHERLPGYETTGDPAVAIPPDDGRRFPDPPPDADLDDLKTAAGPDAMRVPLEEVRELRHSAESFAEDEREDASDAEIDEEDRSEHTDVSSEKAPRHRGDDTDSD